MKNIATLFCVLTFSLFANAQGDFFAMDKNLSLTFPKNPDSGRMAGVVVYYLSTKEASFVASYSEKRSFRINGKEHFYRILNGYASGLFSVINDKNFAEENIDTTLGGVPGKFLRAYAPQDSTGMREMQCFITIQDGHIYAVQVMINRANQMDLSEIVRNFFGSLQFHGTPFKAQVSAKAAPVQKKEPALTSQPIPPVESKQNADTLQKSKGRRGRN